MALVITEDIRDEIEIAVTLKDSFLQAVPEYFTLSDGKLYHDHNKVNVFSHGRKLFVHSLGEVVTFESPAEFDSIKQRLLNNPIYLSVNLKQEKKSGNTSYITRGDFIVVVNPQHPDIQTQLSSSLGSVEQLMLEGKKFALEIKFDKVLKSWYKLRFPEAGSSYESNGSNFCITNFSQRMHMCYQPLVWLVCFPCLLLTAPFYCTHRKLKCHDKFLNIIGDVRYVEGVSQETRDALELMVRSAYAAGVNDARDSQSPMM